MSTRSRIVAFGSAAVLIAVGIVAGIAIGGTFGQLLAFVLVALGFVLATALAFFEVGLSEDRERAREAAARREAPPSRQRRPRLRLERRRGQRRRLD